MSYHEYLQSNEWKIRRDCRLQIDGFECVLCGATEKLNVHHRHYRNIFREDVRRDLVTLCEKCHSAYHGYRQAIASMEFVPRDLSEVNNIIDLLSDSVGGFLEDYELDSEIWIRVGDLNCEESSVLMCLFERLARDRDSKVKSGSVR